MEWNNIENTKIGLDQFHKYRLHKFSIGGLMFSFLTILHLEIDQRPVFHSSEFVSVYKNVKNSHDFDANLNSLIKSLMILKFSEFLTGIEIKMSPKSRKS